MHMVWEKGLLKLMQRLKEGPEAIDKSSNKYIVRFFCNIFGIIFFSLTPKIRLVMKTNGSECRNLSAKMMFYNSAKMTGRGGQAV